MFGAFTPVPWPSPIGRPRTAPSAVADPSGRTFLFSLANAHGRSVKLRLKPCEHRFALNFEKVGSGPCFGSGDLHLMWGEAADGPHGCFAQPNSFDLDHEAEAAAGLPAIPFPYDQTLLAGDAGRHERGVVFAAAEIEVYEL